MKRMGLYSHALKSLFIGFSLISFSLAIADTQNRSDSKRMISFSQAKPKIFEESKKIIDEATVVFEKLSGKQAGIHPVQIFVTDHLMNQGHAVRSGNGEVQGVTFFGSDGYIIQISSRRTSSLGRVLAHEIAHVLVREVYGKVENNFLNEGLAEYISDQVFPSEVRSQMRAAQGKIIPPSMRPYVEGYRFIYDHVDDPMFKNFLAVELQNPISSGKELKNRWEEWKSTPLTLSKKAQEIYATSKHFESKVLPPVQSIQAKAFPLEPKVHPQPLAQPTSETHTPNLIEEDQQFDEDES